MNRAFTAKHTCMPAFAQGYGASKRNQCDLQGGNSRGFSREGPFYELQLSAYAKATADRSAFAAKGVGGESAAASASV